MSDVYVDEHHLPLNIIKHPLPPNTKGSIPPPADANNDDQPLPPNTEGGIPSPPDVEIVEHPLPTNTAENIPSLTDVTTGPAPVELLFLQE